jgi:GntR family transcriptional regulator/MocR family aminotransferase
MPSRDPLITIGIRADASSSIPLYRQLYERLRSGILAGQWRAGLRLPLPRSLAHELRVWRNTVTTAYDQVLAEGYIESRVGYGTTVVALLPEHLIDASSALPSLGLRLSPIPIFPIAAG